MSFFGSETAKVLGWPHKMKTSTQPIMFIEIDAGHDKTLRISKEHYIVSKTNTSAQLSNIKPVADIIPGNLVPMWNEEDNTVSWHEVVSTAQVAEHGFFTPLLSTSGQLVTSAGFIVPLLAELNNGSTSSDPNEFITPLETYTVYNAWIGHWVELAINYPCLDEFDSEFNEIEGVRIMERFFQLHPHDVDTAIDTSVFLNHIKNNPEDLVGEDMTQHLHAFCPELFVDSN